MKGNKKAENLGLTQLYISFFKNKKYIVITNAEPSGGYCWKMNSYMKHFLTGT